MERGRLNRKNFLQKLATLPWKPVIIILFLITVVVVSGFIYYQQQKKAVFGEQVNQLDAIADLKAAEIAHWLGERIGDAEHISENPIFKTELLTFLSERPADRRRESIQGWMSSLRKNYHYENVMLLDRQGNTILSASTIHNEIGAEDLKILEQARKRSDTVISGLYKNPNVPHIHLDIITPLLADHEAVAFVLLRIDPNQFLFPLIQTWPTPSSSAETLLVTPDGKDVLFLNELRHKKNTALKLRQPLQSPDLPAAQAVQGRRGPFFGRDYRGIHVWAVGRPVANTTWSIVAKVDRDEIERPLRNRALAIFLAVIFLIFSGAGLVLFFWQRQNTQFLIGQLAAETAQRESEKKFKQVFETANVGKSITLPNGEINVNKAFCEMLGYSQEELQNKKWQELTPADEVGSIQKMLEPLLQGQKETARFTKRYIRKDGSIVWADVSVVIRRDAKGKPLHFITTIVDITERKQAENEIRRLNEELEQRVLQRTEQLQAANKELEAFSYSVSHDLRAPLRAIDGFASIILEDYAPRLDKEGKRLLAVITANTLKMGHLIDDLLTFSRLSRQPLAVATVNLTVMARVVCLELKKQEKGRHIVFKVGTLPVARGDYAMLQQVLQNLLANAVKFTRTRARARIEISGEAGQEENIYRITDNGVGFDMQYVGKLFGVFQRLHSADEFEGTGVGLAIVQRIILRHGGRVWAESGKGGGATFYFSLPTEANPEMVEPPTVS